MIRAFAFAAVAILLPLALLAVATHQPVKVGSWWDIWTAGMGRG